MPSECRDEAQHICFHQWSVTPELSRLFERLTQSRLPPGDPECLLQRRNQNPGRSAAWLIKRSSGGSAPPGGRGVRRAQQDRPSPRQLRCSAGCRDASGFDLRPGRSEPRHGGPSTSDVSGETRTDTRLLPQEPPTLIVSSLSDPNQDVFWKWTLVVLISE